MRQGKPSLTARWIAAHRADLAGTRPSTPTGDTEAERRLYQGMNRFFVLPGLNPTGMAERTRFIDAEVARAIGRGIAQVVIVGAGYDGRALRFGGGAVRWIEVDFPATQADKQARLAALGVTPGRVTYVGLDLMTDDLGAALGAVGHSVWEPSLFICEGLLAYLPLEVCATLCDSLRDRAAPGSVLTLNVRVVPPAGTRKLGVGGLAEVILRVMGEERQVVFHPGDIEKLLVVTGWSVVRRDASARNRMDGSSHLLVLAAEPVKSP
jgi:methyltransferase (TIGR00027 family)